MFRFENYPDRIYLAYSSFASLAALREAGFLAKIAENAKALLV